MKKLLFIIFTGLFVLSGCNDTVTETVTYMINEPVFMSAENFRSSVNVTTRAEVISNYGKMCFYDGYMYISEAEKGIHIIDNRDPSNPQNVGFIELIGNADLAIRNGKLYADAFIDLVWFDITTPESPELEGRLENVFQKALPLPPTDNDYGIDYQYLYGYDGSEGIIVGWEVKPRTASVPYEPNRRRRRWDIDYAMSPAAESLGSNGINGSMSRFALYKDYLYIVINNNMSVIDLSGDAPKQVAENMYIGWDVETIFSYKENMFMGTPSGMLIYSVADPLNPVQMSVVSHIFGCDPVVVEDDIAYVTIHSGNFCGQNTNELLIYDVSDVKNPQHIVSYAMKNPKGLGIDNSTLFLCDDGLKVFDAKDPQTLLANQLVHYSGMDGFDVIPFNNVLMMIADDGFYQYDYSDLNKISQLSKLPVVR